MEELEKTILALPAVQRIALAESLLQSIPLSSEICEEQDEWAEVELRDKEIEIGLVKPLTQIEFWLHVANERQK